MYKIKDYITRLKSFSLETLKVNSRCPCGTSSGDLIRYFPKWWGSLNPGRNPLNDMSPWIAFSAVDFIEKILNNEVLVFEFGAGGSTLFFAKRTKKVFSVEHNKEWFEKVSGTVKKLNINNVELYLYEPKESAHTISKNPYDPDGYVSDDEKYKGMSFEDYAKSIEKFPSGYFDYILIDGRSRPSCFKHSIDKIKIGGHIILDNAEIPHYSYIHKMTDNDKWRKYDFYGLFPYIMHFSRTCIWKRVK